MRITWCTSKSARDQPIFYLPKWLFWAAPFQCLYYLGYITLAKTSHTIPSIVWKSWQIFQGFFPTHWLQKVASTFRLGHCKYMKIFRGILFIILYWIIVSFWKSFSPLDSKEKMHLQKYTVFSEMFIHFLMYQFFEIFTVFTYKVLGRKFDSYKCYLHILKLEVYDTS